MRHIVQIAPAIEPGRGVEAVAHHLEREFRRAGARVDRFTLSDAGGDWLPEPRGGMRGRAGHALRVAWFSTVGTVLARRYLARNPDAVAICHNDALTGDVYVNHGILQVAMRARGRYAGRMVRNPLHLFTAVRDHLRYRSGTHRLVVNLTRQEDRDLRGTYPSLRPGTVVIGNGVDLDRFAPPTPDERRAARATLGLGEDDVALLFVGHEFERKGLPAVLAALAELPPQVHLVVVGGSADMVAALVRTARRNGVQGRLHAVGADPEPQRYFHASDVLVFPSAYESFGLVVLEAMASGLPVIATRVGCVGDVVDEGVNGFVVDGRAAEIRDRVLTLLGSDRVALGRAARRTAEAHGWACVAREYLAVVDRLAARRAATASRPR